MKVLNYLVGIFIMTYISMKPISGYIIRPSVPTMPRTFGFFNNNHTNNNILNRFSSLEATLKQIQNQILQATFPAASPSGLQSPFSTLSNQQQDALKQDFLALQVSQLESLLQLIRLEKSHEELKKESEVLSIKLKNLERNAVKNSPGLTPPPATTPAATPNNSSVIP